MAKPILLIGMPPEGTIKTYQIARSVKQLKEDYHVLIYPLYYEREWEFDILSAEDDVTEMDIEQIQQKVNELIDEFRMKFKWGPDGEPEYITKKKEWNKKQKELKSRGQ